MSLLASATSLRARLRAKYAAEAAYWTNDRIATQLHRKLRTAASPRDRTALLALASLAERAMGITHAAAFGPVPADDGTDRDMAEVHTDAAELLFGLAYVEHSFVFGCRRLPVRADIEAVAAEVLNLMAASPRLDDRGALLEPLYHEVLPVVGGHAAEAVACLPSPGHTGWRRHETFTDWLSSIRADRPTRRKAA